MIFFSENKVWEQVAEAQEQAETMYENMKESILMTTSADSATSVNKNWNVSTSCSCNHDFHILKGILP